MMMPDENPFMGLSDPSERQFCCSSPARQWSKCSIQNDWEFPFVDHIARIIPPKNPRKCTKSTKNPWILELPIQKGSASALIPIALLPPSIGRGDQRGNPIYFAPNAGKPTGLLGWHGSPILPLGFCLVKVLTYSPIYFRFQPGTLVLRI